VGSYPNPSPKKSREYDSTEFYVQCAIKFVHDHENFRWKSLKGNRRGGIREGKERGPPGYFVQGPRVPSYATGQQIIGQNDGSSLTT